MITWIVLEQGGKKYFLEMPHVRYYTFAFRNFARYQEKSQVVAVLRKDKDHLPPVQAENAWWEYHESMINVLVYGALSLEAYINYYAKRYDIPFNTEFEKKLSTLNKWKMYPTFKMNKQIDRSAIDTIKKVFKLRDEFVHPKPERIIQDAKPYEGKSAAAELEKMDKARLLKDINAVFSAMFNIDTDEAEAHQKQPWLLDLIKKS